MKNPSYFEYKGFQSEWDLGVTLVTFSHSIRITELTFETPREPPIFQRIFCSLATRLYCVFTLSYVDACLLLYYIVTCGILLAI